MRTADVEHLNVLEEACQVLEEAEESLSECWNPQKSALRWRLNYRKRRYLGRFYTGLAVAKSQNQTVGWFCLTESDEALREKIPWRKASNKFFTFLRRVYPGIEYNWVEHRQGKPSDVTGERRRNVHVVYRWSGLVTPLAIAEEWQKVYSSSARRIEVLGPKQLNKTGRYLAAYLSGPQAEADAVDEKFVRCYFSRGWVFKGSVGHYRAYKRDIGGAPCESYMVSFANLPEAEREMELDLDGRGLMRYRVEIDEDFDRVERQWTKGAYVDPDHLAENWGVV